jgi:hypothetical protein
MNLPKKRTMPLHTHFSAAVGNSFGYTLKFASPVREGINQIRACRFWREASRPAVQKSTMRTVYISSGGVNSKHGHDSETGCTASDWRENDPLLTPQQVAERLNTSLDWVRDHSSRKMPLLPVILIEFRRFLDSQVPIERGA